MRITNQWASGKPTFSFEFFPPKDEEGERKLWAAIEGLESIAPDFISVTYGAGGSTRDRTTRITSEIGAHTKIPTVAHLTCVGSTRDELIDVLAKYREAGIHNILALRGDPVGGPRAPWETTPGGFDHADQLVSLAAEIGGFGWQAGPRWMIGRAGRQQNFTLMMQLGAIEVLTGAPRIPNGAAPSLMAPSSSG